MVLATYLVNVTRKEYVYLSLYEAEVIGSTLASLEPRWDLGNDLIAIWHAYKDCLNQYLLLSF
jgi:hypothetical protein